MQKVDCEQRIKELLQEKQELENKLAEEQKKVKTLQNVVKTNIWTEEDHLQKFDDTNVSVLPVYDTDNIVSLCKVFIDHKGKIWLKRYADLDNDGKFTIFKQNDSLPPYFENRDLLYYYNGPSQQDFYGIWTWHVGPNDNDPSRDFMQSQYNPKIEPIEIVIIHEALTIQSLKNFLKKGIDCQTHSRRIMFSCKSSKEQYLGILCNIKDLKDKNGKLQLSKNIVSVPIYKFSSKEVLHLASGLTFYRKAFAGTPNKVWYVKSSLDLVKDIVLSSLTADLTKKISRSKRQELKTLLEAVPIDNVISKIEIAYNCSTSAAQELFDDFMKCVWQFIDGKTLEDEVLRNVINDNPELQYRTKELIREEWEEENENLLAQAEEKKEVLQFELKETFDKLKEKQENLNQIKAQEIHLKETIAEKEKLALEVEEAVTSRIQKAKDNVADFIANMAFVGEKPISSDNASLLNPNEVTLKTEQNLYTVTSECKNKEDLEIHHSWEEVIDTTVYELQEAGVSQSYSRGLATFLCAAYIEKQPILLIGPNAIDIAQAFSAAVTAQKYGLLRCEGDYSQQSVEKIGKDKETIVLINNLIENSWINRLPEVLSNKDVFYIATHPYEEDIQVEPRSLYDFILPLFTESFVDKKASGVYYGGYFSDDFISFENLKNGSKEELKLPEMLVSPIIKNSLQNLISTMYGINSSTSIDSKFLFCIFPIVYATTPFHELTEKMTSLYQDLGISANLKRDLQYILEKSNG